MERFASLTGVAAPLLQDDVDTDQIIPVPDMVGSLDPDFGKALFVRWRFDGAGKPNPAFILNRKPYDEAKILIAGTNFGCGSSREHAVWALAGFGIRCVIAVSFGEIFMNNCIRRGLLPIALPRAQVEALAARVSRPDASALLTVDLAMRRISSAGDPDIPFVIADDQRDRLLNGADPIAETLHHRTAIETWEAADRRARPWVHVSLRAAVVDRS